jgi:formylmethanofuran dehydrogenase subunit E
MPRVAALDRCRALRPPALRPSSLADLLPLLAVLLAACVASPRPSSEAAEWYYFDWLADAPQAPRFRVLDTESSLGPYAEQDKVITLKDLVKMHGHACDGLVTAACALKVGLDALYPDGVVDRTDTGCITKNSPCYGDVGAYLTGGRIRFGTQKIDPTLGDVFVLYRFSTGQAVRVSLKHGVFPAELASLETKIRSGDFTDGEMRACQQAGWDYARCLVDRPLAESFDLTVLPEAGWVPDEYEHTGQRGDVVNKGR